MAARCAGALGRLLAGVGLGALCWFWAPPSPAQEVLVQGQIVDAGNGQPLAARLYIRALAEPAWRLAETANPQGPPAAPYSVSRSPAATETHTALPAGPFVARLAPGRYEFLAERGKEYLPAQTEVTVDCAGASVRLELRRWIDMQQRGWYSGETHVHRTLAELPVAMLADDLNVTLPLTYWVRNAFQAPTAAVEAGAAPHLLIEIDPTHVIYPVNTEYEIFRVGTQAHTLGALFFLNHRRPLQSGVPPVGEAIRQARKEGALLELDKHNWPWSMAIAAAAKVDLYELTNNHLWRCEFFFRDFGAAPAQYMQCQTDPRGGLTERGWIDFTLQNYYALLNCGLRMRPTAGTASGVHPVPLGFGRVYVALPDGFTYASWMEGLAAGRSFVTTGPLLEMHVDQHEPGAAVATQVGARHRIHGVVFSEFPLSEIEVLASGRVVASLPPVNEPRQQGGYQSAFEHEWTVDDTGWLCVRCWEPRADRRRFAHGSPVFLEVPDHPLRPSAAEAKYLLQRVRQEMQRSEQLLPAAALQEYAAAEAFFEQALQRAR